MRTLIGLITCILIFGGHDLAAARPEVVRVQPAVVRTHAAPDPFTSPHSDLRARQPYKGTVRTLGGIFPGIIALAYNSDTGGVFTSQLINSTYVISNVSRTGHATQLAQFGTSVYGLVYERSAKVLYAAVKCSIVAISPATGAVSPFVGGTCGTNDGKGAAAQFQGPTGLALDPVGKILYVSDNDRVRSVTLDGVVVTITAPGSIGPPQPRPCWQNTQTPTLPYDGLAFDTDNGNVYVANSCVFDIRQIVPSTGAVTIVAGLCFQGQAFGCVDLYRDGTGSTAQVAGPAYIAFSRQDHSLYLSDSHNNLVRRVNLSGGGNGNGTLTTFAGSGHPEYRDGVGAFAGFSTPLGLVTTVDGSLYVADSANQIIRTIVTQGPPPPPPAHGITLYDLPATGETPNMVAAAADGSVWYSAIGTTILGRILPGGQITEFPVPSGVFPGILAFDTAGNVWFANAFNGALVGKFTPSTGATALYPIPSGNYAQGLALGSDGNIWFVTGNSASIGVVTPAGGIIEYAADPDSYVTSGFDGNLWTLGNLRSQAGGYVDQISTHGKVLKRYVYPSLQAGPIAKGPQRRIWFAQPSAIGEVFDHNVLLFQLPPSPLAPIDQGMWNPMGLVEGPDRALWFTANLPGYICRMTDSGAFSPYEIPAPRSAPVAMTRASNGALWFSDPGALKIGRWY